MRKVTLLLSCTFVFVFALSNQTRAAVPQLINYQGRVTDSAGVPLDGPFDIVQFTIYDAESAGNAIWFEEHTTIVVTDGLFNVLLGSVTELVDTVFNDTNRYLGISLDGGVSEIMPRTRLVTTPYAFRVNTVDGASGGTISGDVVIQSDLTVDGNIGIGTTSPTTYLHIKGPTGPTGGDFLRIEPTDLSAIPKISIRHTDGSEVMILSANPTGASIHGIGGAPLYLGAGGFVRQTIHSSGNVGIGTTTPSEKLDVVGNIKITGDLTVSGNIIGSTPWTSLPLASGYNNYVDSHGGDFQICEYRKIGDIVYLRGLIHKTDHATIGAGAIMAILPAGFKPQNSLGFAQAQTRRVDILQSGEIIAQFASTSNEFVFLDGIFFSTSP